MSVIRNHRLLVRVIEFPRIPSSETWIAVFNMSRKYSRSLLRISVAQICQNLGWHSAQSSSLEVLTDVLERYLSQLGGICHRYAEQFGRTQANLDDLGLAFRHMGINLSELEDYVRHVEPVPFAHEVVAFPAPKPAVNLGFPNPRSREVLQHREEHIPSHMPFMFPNLKDEIPEEKSSPNVENIENAEQQDLTLDGNKKDDPLSGDKRPAGSLPAADMPPSKRPRFGNSYLPEEVTQSQYEMTCVFMGPNGVLTTRQGVQGRLPEACMPPPNPRTLIERANKENSVKSKESGLSTKITIGVGGIGANVLPSSKHDKKSKKSLHKKNFVHEHSTKSFLDSNKDSKKSFSSKAAAKFLKKLKASKKSSKIFSKPKFKELKASDGDEGTKDSTKKAVEISGANLEGKPKKRKEKKSVAIIVDSDEELRNLSTPSSSRSSPDRLIIKDSEGSAVKKAQMEAINDSINSVLREAPVKEDKVRKKKKKEVKSEEQIGESPEGKVKRKPGRPPKKVEPPLPPPPPIDIKPFVSDKYSPKELEVYEFSDSPPPSVLNARRLNPTESVSPAPLSQAQPTTHAPHQAVKHENAPPPKPKVHKRVEPEDQLFAPEIKFDTMVKSVSKDKQKPKTKEEKKKDLLSKDSDKPKPKDEKNDKHKEKKDKGKILKVNPRADNLKDKDYKKDKRDKKKEKEKKKKHKEREKEREKDKLKKIENKLKQEPPVSRESSPANVLGVKLKIKIGGSTGPSSMMVTGESSSATPSPSSLVGSKRDSVSPHKIIPKLYISKGPGGEEKPKKSSKIKSDGKHKSSPMTSVKSSPASNAQTSPSPRSTPTPPVPRKTPTPPPPKSDKISKEQTHDRKKDTSLSKKRKSRSPVKVSRKEKKKDELSSLSEDSSLSPPASPAKSKAKKRSKTPPKLQKAASSSSSPEKSPPSLPFQSPTPSPRPSSRATRSPSRASSHHNSSVSPPPLSRRNFTPPPSLSPEAMARNSRHQSPSPTRPPTPGSTSPTQSPIWNLPISPTHHRSPTPTPRTPTASPKRDSRSPSRSSPPGSPASPRKSSSPAAFSSGPGSRAAGSPDPYLNKEIPSPSSSCKSSAAAVKPARTVEAETVCVYTDDSGQKIWICPGCKLPDDGSEMIGCDMCDNWYHWPCVGITEAPPETQDWYCVKCLPKTKSSRGRGRPRGRGRGRGKKKIT
ncbi:transcription initiation factor TFIID subunit 3 [Biomphalaria glabrata]|nr:transcription initiation factor TFIID subunit 3 [Biomphalaria glabrata]